METSARFRTIRSRCFHFSKPCHIAIDFDKIGYKVTDLAVKKEPYESPCQKSANADKSA
jgi:hypothetical protein